MRDPTPWLSQGDIFEDVPQPLVEPQGAGLRLREDLHGPSLLVTHDCALDKTNGRQEVRIRRLFFLPVLAATAIGDANQLTDLRRNVLEPYESLYIGDAGHLGEAYVVLSEAYYLPASIFDPRLEAFEDHPEAETGKAYLTARSLGARVGRLESDEISLLRAKWTAFWTRQIAEEDDEKQ